METWDEIQVHWRRRLPEESWTRISRAIDICQGEGDYIIDHNKDKTLYAVHNGRGEIYTVSPSEGWCTCPDSHKARLGLCKHLIAVMIMEGKENDN